MDRVLRLTSWVLLVATAAGYLAQVLRGESDPAVGGLIFLVGFVMARVEEISRRQR
jgi:energy-converting hydrogenase Eha subunit C